jgi:hypothetical protein
MSYRKQFFRIQNIDGCGPYTTRVTGLLAEFVEYSCQHLVSPWDDPRLAIAQKNGVFAFRTMTEFMDMVLNFSWKSENDGRNIQWRDVVKSAQDQGFFFMVGWYIEPLAESGVHVVISFEENDSAVMCLSGDDLMRVVV